MRFPAICAGFAVICAAQPALSRPVTAPDRVQDAVTQPLRDLSIMRRHIPPALQRALQGPYDAPAPTTCGQIAAEVAELDAALGPDFDTQAGVRRTNALRGLVVDGVRGVVDLPFRGIIRVITGARRRDETLQSAILAGVSRRSFLKGLSRAMACQDPQRGAAIAQQSEEPLLVPDAPAREGAAVDTVAEADQDGPSR